MLWVKADADARRRGPGRRFAGAVITITITIITIASTIISIIITIISITTIIIAIIVIITIPGAALGSPGALWHRLPPQAAALPGARQRPATCEG